MTIKSHKKIVITGANGYLGRHTIKNAIQRGWIVKGIVRRKEAAEIIKNLGAEPYITKKFEKNALIPIFKESDAVIHLIGITSPEQGSFEEINVGTARIVLESALESGISRVITPSGLGVDQYGIKPWATNDYFLSKLRIEELFQENSIPFVIFRPSYIIGPGDDLIPSLMSSLMKGLVYVIGEGTTPLQPIYVKDATTAFLNAAQNMGPDNMIYDLVGPEIVNMNQLIKRVSNIMQKEGYNLPKFQIQYISTEEAFKLLDMAKEEIAITRCDVLGDNKMFTKQLKIKLSKIDEGIRAAIREAQV